MYARSYLPGFLFCLFVSLVASLLAQALPSVGHISLSLLLGMLLGNFFRLPSIVRPGCAFAEKRILEFSIALLGFNLSRHELGFLDAKLVTVLVSMVVLTICLSSMAGKWFRFPGDLGFLIGVGSGICGSAAIMASSGVLKSSKRNVVISLAITQFLGIIAMFLLPFLFRDFDKSFSAYMIGGALQAMGHVVASTSLLDAESANIAITVKMIRILLLTPLVLILSVYMSKKKTGEDSENSALRIPFYIFCFIFFVFLANFFELSSSFTGSVKKVSHFFFSIAMAGLGSNIKFEGLSKGFARYVGFAAVLFSLQCVFLFLCH